MRTILVLCLVFFVAFSFGCSKKKEETPKPETSQPPSRSELIGKPILLIDPVSREEIEPVTAQFSYEYNGSVYYFTSNENMEAFKADPEKYLAAIAADQQAVPSEQQKQ